MLRFLTQLLRNPSTPATRRTCQPCLEALEDRLTPSAATVNLTTLGSQGTINGAIFQQGSPHPDSGGFIDPFLTVQSRGVEQGYNTNARPVQFADESRSPFLTHAIRLSDIPEVSINGVDYRVFILDINQDRAHPLLSLDELQIFEGNAGNLTGYNAAAGQLDGISPLYDLNAGGGSNWVELNSRLSRGYADMTVYVPDADFLKSATSTNPYVYLYSQFGVHEAANGGAEQWAVQKPRGPAPASLSGFVTKSGGVAAGVMVTLTGVTANGKDITLTAITNSSGFYTFDDLTAGTYTLSISPPSGYKDTANAGSLGGTAGTQITDIDVKAGQNGLGYDFQETPSGGGGIIAG